MDTRRRPKKTQPYKFSFQSIAISLIVLISCTSGNKNVITKSVEEEDVDFEIPDGYDIPEFEQLTEFGENHSPSYNPSGTKIIFVSNQRIPHRSHQIYEIELATKYEKRITYNSGENFLPRYDPRGRRVVYLSNTDEIKERPSLIALAKNQDIPVDIVPESLRDPGDFDYLSKQLEVYFTHLTNHSIRRVTTHPGYDSYPQFSPDGKRVLFARLTNNVLSIKDVNLSRRNARARTKRTLGQIQLNGLRVSPNGKKYAWIQREEDGHNNLVLADHKLNAIDAPFRNFNVRSVSWHPNSNGLVVTASPKGQSTAEIFSFDIETKCGKRLTYDGYEDLEAEIDPTGKKIAFSSDRKGSRQIFQMEFKPPTSCTFSLAQSDAPKEAEKK